MAIDISRHLTVKQVAGRLRCHPRTVHWWAQRKNYGPPFIRIGHKYFYDPDEFERWLESQPTYRPPGAVA